MMLLTEQYKDILEQDAQARRGYGADGMDVDKRDKLLNDHRIIITNRYTAQNIMTNGLIAHIVRVTNDMGRFLPLSGDYYTETQLFVNDVDSEDALTDEMADKAIEAFDVIEDLGYNLVVFHCFAGIQRSATVAMAFAYFLGNPEALEIESLIGTNNMFRPHWAMYRKLCRKIDNYKRGE